MPEGMEFEVDYVAAWNLKMYGLCIPLGKIQTHLQMRQIVEANSIFFVYIYVSMTALCYILLSVSSGCHRQLTKRGDE